MLGAGCSFTSTVTFLKPLSAKNLLMASMALSFMLSVTTLSFDNPTLVSRSSFSPFFMPINLKSASLGRSVMASSINKFLPSSFVKNTSTSTTRFCFHNLLIALLKASEPGNISLSPMARPEIEMIKFWSNALAPVTVMPAKLYCVGTLELKISINCGLTETGTVSFWLKANCETKTAITDNKKFG